MNKDIEMEISEDVERIVNKYNDIYDLGKLVVIREMEKKLKELKNNS
jgi:hypothetical protein